MQHVTVKSTHFAAWSGHFMFTLWVGVFTGGLIGLVFRQITEDSGSFDIGVCTFLGMVIYIICWLVYMFVRAGLGCEDY